MMESLEQFRGMDWKEVGRAIKKNAVVLMGQKDDSGFLVDVVREAMKGNVDAAAASVATGLFMKDNGAPMTVRQAVKFYRDAVKVKMVRDPKGNYDSIQHSLNSLEEMLAWGVCGRSGTTGGKWAIKLPHWRRMENYAGLANIMLWLASLELDKGMAATSDRLALHGISQFLQEQRERSQRMEKKHEKVCKRKLSKR